jgi:phage tail sheath gpL-like
MHWEDTMATSNTPAVASGPIEYTDPNSGKMTVVPLSALSFDSKGVFVPASPYNTSARLKDWLAYLVKSAQIVPDIGAAQHIAMILRATTPGSSGNNITVQIDGLQLDPDPTKVTFDVTVVEEDTYTKLTPDTVKKVLGTTNTPGTRPGLVHLLDTDTPALPTEASAKSLQGGNATTNASLPMDADAGSSPAFTLQAKAPGADGNTITVAISNVDKTTDPLPPTFDLTASWKPAKVSGITLQTLGAQMATFAYIITTFVPNGGAFSVPKPDTYHLSGGADAAPVTSASALVEALL